MAILAEALAEPSGIAGRVAEHDPKNLGFFIGQRAFCDFPNLVTYRRCLIEDTNDPPPLIVQPGKRFGIIIGPRNRIGAPCFLVLHRVKRGRREVEPLSIDRQFVPLRQLGPGLCRELRRSVRRHNALTVQLRAHRPIDQPGDHRRFTGAVA